MSASKLRQPGEVVGSQRNNKAHVQLGGIQAGGQVLDKGPPPCAETQEELLELVRTTTTVRLRTRFLTEKLRQGEIRCRSSRQLADQLQRFPLRALSAPDIDRDIAPGTAGDEPARIRRSCRPGFPVEHQQPGGEELCEDAGSLLPAEKWTLSSGLK